MLLSSKVFQAFSGAIPLFCLTICSRKYNHKYLDEITKMRTVISVLVVGCTMLLFFMYCVYKYSYTLSFLYIYIFFLYDLKQFKSITKNKVHVYFVL